MIGHMAVSNMAGSLRSDPGDPGLTGVGFSLGWCRWLECQPSEMGGAPTGVTWSLYAVVLDWGDRLGPALVAVPGLRRMLGHGEPVSFLEGPNGDWLFDLRIHDVAEAWRRTRGTVKHVRETLRKTGEDNLGTHWRRHRWPFCFSSVGAALEPTETGCIDRVWTLAQREHETGVRCFGAGRPPVAYPLPAELDVYLRLRQRNPRTACRLADAWAQEHRDALLDERRRTGSSTAIASAESMASDAAKWTAKAREAALHTVVLPDPEADAETLCDLVRWLRRPRVSRLISVLLAGPDSGRFACVPGGTLEDLDARLVFDPALVLHDADGRARVMFCDDVERASAEVATWGGLWDYTSYFPAHQAMLADVLLALDDTNAWDPAPGAWM